MLYWQFDFTPLMAAALPDYDELEDELRALDAINAAEAHGVIAGMTTAAPTHIDAGIRIVLADVDVDVDANTLSARHLLEDVGVYTEARLTARDSELKLLLPDETQPLDARTRALADFCRGYVLGLVAGGVRELNTLPGDAREVVEDFMKISDVEVSSLAETEEQALAQLTEYVRTGVQVVYEELHGAD